MSLSRPLLIGLVASAALNVFLIGGIAGMAYMRLSSPPPAPQPAPAQPILAPVQPPPVAPFAAPVPQPVAPVRRPPPVVAAPPSETPLAPAQSSERLARPPLWTAADQLSPQARKALRQALHAANLKNQPITRQARTERQAALTALSSDVFDPAEVNRRLTSARALDQQARANVEAALAAYAATLTPSERAVLAEGLSRIYTPRKAARQGPGAE